MSNMEAIQTIFVLSVIGGIIFLAVAVALFLMKALALFEISSKERLKNPWYAFIPYFNDYTLGRLADSTNGSLPKLLPLFGVLKSLMAVISFISFGNAAIELTFMADEAVKNGKEMTSGDFKVFSTFVVIFLINLLVILVYKLIRTVGLYKLFKKLSVKNAVLYSVLSFVFTFLIPIFLFSARGERITERAQAEETTLFNFGE